MTRALSILPILFIAAATLAADEAADAAGGAAGQAHPLIEQLDHDEYDLRESATRQLILLGQEVAPLLKEAALKGSAEVSWRAVHALSEIAVAEEFDQRNPAEEALASLKLSDKLHVARRAEDVLRELPESRAARAIEMVRSLGGKVDESGTVVTLDDLWKGGDNGLRYMRHLKDIRHIHIEPTAKVTRPAVNRLRESLPQGVSIMHFGTAFLGVGAASNDDGRTGMLVLTVREDSPAFAGGIRENDNITKIDSTRIDDFDDLVAFIRNKEAGDEVVIEYERNDPLSGGAQTHKAKIKLTARDSVKVNTAPGKPGE